MRSRPEYDFAGIPQACIHDSRVGLARAPLRLPKELRRGARAYAIWVGSNVRPQLETSRTREYT